MANEDAIESLILKVETAKYDLEIMIKSAIAVQAQDENLDEASFTFVIKYVRNGEEVDSTEIDKLAMIFCEHVHHCGFQDVWTSSDGWLAQ